MRFLRNIPNLPLSSTVDESSAEKIHARITNLLNNLKRRPLAARTNASSSDPTSYGLVDYRVAHSALFVLLYSPYKRGGAKYPALELAHALSEAEKGNGAPLLNYGTFWEPPKCECSLPGGPKSPAYLSIDALAAIMCSDGPALNDTLEDLEDFYDTFLRQSEFADAVPFRGLCK